ncbi:hypothetical protein IJJ05_02460 [Candidatus Saccharibacteria bacterium]|nr:hypothetical protein [Candidatus Saccharibacteria bacterium]
MIKLVKRHGIIKYKDKRPSYTFFEGSTLFRPSSRFGLFEQIAGCYETLDWLALVYSNFDEEGNVGFYFNNCCETILCYKNQNLVAIAFLIKNLNPSQCRIDIVFIKNDDKTSESTNILLEKCYSWFDPLKPAIITMANQKEFSNFFN